MTCSLSALSRPTLPGHDGGTGELLRPAGQREVAALERGRVEAADARVEDVDTGVDERVQHHTEFLGVSAILDTKSCCLCCEKRKMIG